MPNIFTGDTVRVKAAFRDWAPEGQQGALIDPDGNAATATIYNSEQKVLSTGAAIREGLGSYYYDWTAPSKEGIYFVEFKGLFSTLPQLAREKYTVRFRPVVES